MIGPVELQTLIEDMSDKICHGEAIPNQMFSDALSALKELQDLRVQHASLADAFAEALEQAEHQPKEGTDQ